MKNINIGNWVISKESKSIIIAELSANHNGSIDTAIETIRAAKRAGADGIKFQTYTADTMTLDSEKPDFIIKGSIWNGMNLYKLYQDAFTPWEWHLKLFEAASDEGLLCFSTPFDLSSVDFLETLNVPAYKIASFEITDTPLIEYVASKGKPIIISTGIAKVEDIELALKTCRDSGNDQIVLLKCTSSYPAPLEEANLSMIKHMSEKFDVYTGLSDHTMGSVAPVIATTLGAKIIEKHFILDRSIGGPDASFSLNETEFKCMVNSVREAEKAIGSIDYSLTSKQVESRAYSRSIYVSEDIKQGDIFTKNNLRIVRPGYGLHPMHYSSLLGKICAKDTEKGTPFSWELITQ